MLQSARWIQGGPTTILAVLIEMMGRGGFIEGKRPSDLGLNRALVPQSHQLTDPPGHAVDFTPHMSPG